MTEGKKPTGKKTGDGKYGAEGGAAVMGKGGARSAIRRGGTLYYVRRRMDGTFADWVRAGRSLAIDRRVKAKTHVPPGQGDRGDTNR